MKNEKAMNNESIFLTDKALASHTVKLKTYLQLFKSHLEQVEGSQENPQTLHLLNDLVIATEQLLSLKQITRRFLTLQEAAYYLRVSRSSLYKKVRNRTIEHCKPDGLLYFPIEYLDEYVLKGRVTTITATNVEVLSHIAKSNRHNTNLPQAYNNRCKRTPRNRKR